MTPQQAAAAAKADYTQNGAAYNSGNTPMLGVTPNTYSYLPDNSGGFNYYQNGSTPITREQYASGSGNPYPTNSTNGGGVLGASTSAASDPYAQWGGAAKYNALNGMYQGQHQNILGAAGSAIGQAGAGIGSSIQDLIDSLKTGQRGVDNESVQNDLAKQQGTQGVLDMVGRGIRSGGVMLANKNASDSSASQALADAYGQLGRSQLSSVGNQFAQGQNKVALDQQSLNDQTTTNVRHINENKTNVINGIVEQARNALSALDSAIAGASLPDRINIEQEKENVRNQAMSQLQQYDQILAQGVGGVHPADEAANRASAASLAAAGTAPANAFQYDTSAPAQFQGTGPFASTLPLFTLGKNKQQA